MNLLIVSGLSGAGKSVAMNALEDIGFFCIDNIPAALLPSITAFSKAGDNQLKRVALCMDIRGCRTPEEIEEALSQLDAQRIEYEILFLDAPDDVLMRRYSETRRRHPMSISDGLSTGSLPQGARDLAAPQRPGRLYHQYRPALHLAEQRAHLRPVQPERRREERHASDSHVLRLQVRHPTGGGSCFGCPLSAQPFYVPELKHKTGLDEEVVDFVMSHPEAQELLKRYESFLEYALPLYVKEGKSQLTIAVGCTGGKHRSITFARKIAEYCEKLGYKPGIQHRDSVR